MRAHREELQRVQVGLVGLAAVLLIVTLANLVVQTARSDSDSANIAEQVTPRALNGNAATGVVVVSKNEPLADLGVTPTTVQPPAPADSAVPDLEPDPRLRVPMDQELGQQTPSQ